MEFIIKAIIFFALGILGGLALWWLIKCVNRDAREGGFDIKVRGPTLLQKLLGKK